jgi:hypothetical protein
VASTSTVETTERRYEDVEQMSGDWADDPILSEMLRYWHRKRGVRAMPARRDIDPTEIPKLLPHIRLTEILDGCTRFRYRLVGTAIVEAYGAGFTGKFTDELYSGERKAYVEGNYHLIHARKRPMFLRSRYVTLKGYDIIANRLMAPLSSNGVDVNMVIAALTFGYDSPLLDMTMHDAALDLVENHLEML